MYTIVIDAGTGGLHVNLVDSTLHLVSKAYAELKYIRDEPPGGWQFKAEELFNMTIGLIKDLVDQSSASGEDVVAIAVTSQRHGAGFLGADRKAIYACPNFDSRAARTAIEFSNVYGNKIYDLTGRWPGKLFPAIRLVWFRENRPDIFRKIRVSLMINDWLAFKLTGNMYSEWTNAAETLLFDITSLKWSDELLQLFNLEHLELPPVVRPGTNVGTLRSDLADQVGLPRGIPVILAGADTQCALLGTGTYSIGDVTVVSGSTTPIQMVFGRPDHPRLKGKQKIWYSPYVLDKWVIEANCGPTGMIYRKFVYDLSDFISIFAPKAVIDYKKLETIALRCKDETQDLLSFLGPVISDFSSAKDLPSILLSNNKDVNFFKSIVPSFIENIAFAVVGNILQLEEISGVTPNIICLTGGSSVNKLLQHIVSLLLSCKICISKEVDSTSVGAAILAFVAIGALSSLNDAFAMIQRQQIKQDTTVNPKEADFYRNKYAEWSRWHKHFMDLVQ